ncbi:MAG TPA: branched-chain amino acid ABC transporter permease [Streptosporangiaceae bacterium]|nr:branched-chain amino acid ABC transporter permease [Streptosporangiaceae bacterium]
MTVFVQLVVSALGFGGIYALAALGLTIIFKTSNVVNFAYGAMATVVAMLVWTAQTGLGLPAALAWVLAIIGGGALGAASEIGFMRRVQESAPLVSIVMTLGMLLIVEGLTGVIWGYGPKAIPGIITGPSIAIGPVSVDRGGLLIVGLTAAIGLGLYFFYERTRPGLAVRAVAEDAEVASLMGISRRWVLTLSWAAGVAVTGAAATLAAPSVGLTPTLMDNIAVFAFAAAVLGGLGSLIGAVVGGFAVGILADLIAGYASANLQLTLVFALIVVVLYLRPQGLFGRAAQVRQ